MKLESHVHVHHHEGDRNTVLELIGLLQEDMAALLADVNGLKGLVTTMAKGMERLELALEGQTTVVGGVELLVKRMATEIRELFPDNAKADALAEKFEAQSARLAAAVAEGTAAADESDANQAGGTTDDSAAPGEGDGETPAPEDGPVGGSFAAMGMGGDPTPLAAGTRHGTAGTLPREPIAKPPSGSTLPGQVSPGDREDDPSRLRNERTGVQRDGQPIPEQTDEPPKHTGN